LSIRSQTLRRNSGAYCLGMSTSWRHTATLSEKVVHYLEPRSKEFCLDGKVFNSPSMTASVRWRPSQATWEMCGLVIRSNDVVLRSQRPPSLCPSIRVVHATSASLQQCSTQSDMRLFSLPQVRHASVRFRTVGGNRVRTRDRSDLICSKESTDRTTPYWFDLTPARLRETRRAANLAPTAKRCSGPKLLAAAGPTK